MTMPMRRTSMNKVREIIRLYEKCHLSRRSIARALSISRPVVSEYIDKIQSSGLNYSSIEKLDDDTLLEIIEGTKSVNSDRYHILREKFKYFVKELKRTGVTLERLWREYREEHPDGYGYSQFCYHFKVWCDASELTMHMTHKAGDKMFVDFAGKHLEIVNRLTGEISEVEVFVAVLGASQRTYVEAVQTQQKHDWIMANRNALHYFGGVPRAIVPDCLKTAITKPDRYEPDVNPEYEDFARYYETVILPARPSAPKDKALVENAVRIIYSRIYASIRNRIFHNLKALNQAILAELEKHNAAPMQRLNISRNQLFLETEKSALKALPPEKYQLRGFKTIKAQYNYHVYFNEDKHFYSVPYRLRGSTVKLIYTQSVVEIFYKKRRIATHQRDRTSGGYTTNPDHMPPKHRFVSEWNPQRFINWARNIGEHVEIVIRRNLESREHPEQAYRACMGILSLARKYNNSRLDKACKRAISFDLYSYKGIEKILKKNLEESQLDTFEVLPVHDNIRGNTYYTQGVNNDQ
jgi:transposase